MRFRADVLAREADRVGRGSVPLAVKNPGRSLPAATSLNDLIRSQQERWRDREAESAGGLEVDGEVISGWLLDGQAIRRGSLEDPIDVDRCPTKVVVRVRPIRHQPTFVDEGARLVHGGNPVLLGKVDDALAVEDR